MRLGKEKGSGYVADTLTDSIAADQINPDPAERTQPAPVAEPMTILEPAHPVG